MKRPLFYVLSLVFHASFWLILLLANYADYTSNAPEVLHKDYAQLFEANRLMLILAELFFPFLMLAASVVLLVVKFRAAPVRLPYLLMLAMGIEYWVWRSFFFQDRMGTYYEMSEMKMQPGNFQEGHTVLLLGYLTFTILIFLFKEYSQTENSLYTDPAALERKPRPKAPWEQPGVELPQDHDME